MIVAMTPERVIGRHQKMPWHIPSDLKRFRQITTEAGTMIMGRATYHAVRRANNGALLPGRHHIVLTRQWTCSGPWVQSVTSVEEALAAARERGEQACVIGGGQIYSLFLPLSTLLHVTLVHATLEGDTFFPKLDPDAPWQCIEETPIMQAPGDEYPTSYRTFIRV
jgi:dihydrofolate reductase